MTTKAQLHQIVKELESKVVLLSEQIALDQEELYNFRTMGFSDKLKHLFGTKPKSKIIDNSLEVFGGDLMATTTNDVTGDSLVTKVSSDAYRSNWDNIFKKPKEANIACDDEAMQQLVQLSQDVGLYVDSLAEE